MISNLPLWIETLLILTCLLVVILFYFSNGKPKVLTAVILVWTIMVSQLAYTGFFQVIETIPPRFAVVLIPTFIFIIYGLLPKQKEWMLRTRNTVISTFIHIVRLPVEIVLFGLFTHKMVPEIMTFEGMNYDIVMGITAPIIGWFFIKNKVSKQLLIAWNIIGLVLILFILIIGIISAELPIQQMAFDQPNRGMTFFPFILIPATIVPIVIWTHITDIVKLKAEIKRS